MVSKGSGKRVDTEITNLCCVFDPDDVNEIRMPYFIGVGWDKKIHVWADEKEEIVESNKTLPHDPSAGHQADIMSTVFDHQNNLIYTGGHDGTLIAWNFETGYRKQPSLHEIDPTCISVNYLEDGKSVD